MKKTIAALWLWLFAVFAAHAGGHSPASYLAAPPARLFGMAVAPEAMEAVPSVTFFYDGGSPTDAEDVHAFVVATLMAFTRSYLLAAYLANLGAMMLLIAVAMTLAERRGLPLRPTAIALAALLAMPVVTHNIGQPAPLIVDTAAGFLAILGALALGDDLAALVAAAAVIVIPSAAWLWFIHWRPHLSEWLVQPWSDFLRHPLDNGLVPFASAHIGLHVALLDLLALIGWPLLLVGAAALWTLRNDIPRTRRTIAVAALAALFALLQLVTAPFDTPNDPRAALPALLAFAIAWCWAAARLWPRRAWRIAIVAVLAVCALAAFADVVLKTPAIAYASTAQAVEANPKKPIDVMETRLAPEPDDRLQWHNVARANLHGATAFFVAQTFMAFFVCALCWILARAALLPRTAPVIAAIVWLASAVRFLA
jgi:hypothetical protein